MKNLKKMRFNLAPKELPRKELKGIMAGSGVNCNCNSNFCYGKGMKADCNSGTWFGVCC